MFDIINNIYNFSDIIIDGQFRLDNVHGAISRCLRDLSDPERFNQDAHSNHINISEWMSSAQGNFQLKHECKVIREITEGIRRCY